MKHLYLFIFVAVGYGLYPSQSQALYSQIQQLSRASTAQFIDNQLKEAVGYYNAEQGYIRASSFVLTSKNTIQYDKTTSNYKVYEGRYFALNNNEDVFGYKDYYENKSSISFPIDAIVSIEAVPSTAKNSEDEGVELLRITLSRNKGTLQKSVGRTTRSIEMGYNKFYTGFKFQQEPAEKTKVILIAYRNRDANSGTFLKQALEHLQK